MSFYQTSQEGAFQALLLKNVQERNGVLEKRIQTVISEANAEVALLSDRLSRMDADLSTEKRKTRELSDSLRTSAKDFARLKSQHDAQLRQGLRPGHSQAAKLQEAAAAAAAANTASATTTGTGSNQSHSHTPFYAGQVGQESPKRMSPRQTVPFWQSQVAAASVEARGLEADGPRRSNERQDAAQAVSRRTIQHPAAMHGQTLHSVAGARNPTPNSAGALHHSRFQGNTSTTSTPQRHTKMTKHASAVRAMPLPHTRRPQLRDETTNSGRDHDNPFRFSAV
ncbi:hypothetical protein IE81DRAFT_353484 [Ceraceosorus guamensis]|uniref:Uncharacterized protein n=1 Tax=Ceraceosorus guamensis TaxID=1522189 RepID=A0A316VP24_9BASI|nr:hypothetical protein IE81DRAFT_353484 [Ceraceosorus guamensis]PWN39064.1 hypothetical protein IE81DRAFT_353484 [Ceraceosorus guamensis]